MGGYSVAAALDHAKLNIWTEHSESINPSFTFLLEFWIRREVFCGFGSVEAVVLTVKATEYCKSTNKAETVAYVY